MAKMSFDESVIHTPTDGEWTFRELGGDDSRGMGYVEAGGEDIAHTGVMAFSKGQNLKIARLIAAAPYLLEITKLFERCLVYDIKKSEAGGDEEGARLKTVTLNLARAALAAAREG